MLHLEVMDQNITGHFIFSNISLYAPPKKCSTCTTFILLNFLHFWVFLDFLESPRCPLNNLFGFISIEVSILNNTSLQKVDFERTYNVLIHIFQMKHFLTKLVRHEVVENWILFKMRGGGKISDKVWESYAWSKFCWLLSKKAQFRNFDFWSILDFSRWIMINPWSNDECYFKIWMLIKNYEVWLYVDHSWLLSNTTDFQPSEQLFEETWLVRLETCHGESLKHMRKHESHWRC